MYKPNTITTNIDQEVYDLFREVIFRRSGLKRGDVRKAMHEGILMYIEKYAPDKAAEVERLREKIRLMKDETVLQS